MVPSQINGVNSAIGSQHTISTGGKDPTQGAGLDAPPGTIGMKLTVPVGFWQKQDDGQTVNWTNLAQAGGGGGDPNNLGVQAVSPPVGAVNDNYWIFTQAAVPATQMSGQITAGSDIVTIAAAVTDQDLLDLGGGVTFFRLDAVNGEGGINITNGNNGEVTIDQEEGVSTTAQVVAALNVYSQALIGKDIATVGAESGGGDFVAETEGSPGPFPIASDGIAVVARDEILLGGVVVPRT